MASLVAFFVDARGALSVDRAALGAGVLLLLGMLVYELFDAGTHALLSTVAPGLAAVDAGSEVMTAEYSARP